MPQLNPGGKFVFGISTVRNQSVQFPEAAVREYQLTDETWVILSSGSRETGGFIVYPPALLQNSMLNSILTDHPALADKTLEPGVPIPHKGRQYCWTPLINSSLIFLNETMLDVFELQEGSRLMVIRSSNLAFTMGARGRLWQRAQRYSGLLEEY